MNLADIVIEETHSCYLGDRSQRHNWGYGCGECPACRLRAYGWSAWMRRRTSAATVASAAHKR